jgi:hypothetical protein
LTGVLSGYPGVELGLTAEEEGVFTGYPGVELGLTEEEAAEL